MASAAQYEHEIYSDDELNDLPPNTLNALDELVPLPATKSLLAKPAVPAASVTKNSSELLQALSSDYGFDDEDIIDLDAQPAQLERSPIQNEDIEAKAREIEEYNSNGGRSLSAGRGLEQAPYEPVKLPSSDTITHHSLINVGELRFRIQELEDEKTRIQQALRSAKSDVISKAGEIAIVRANHEKITKEFERRINGMQKLHVEETNRQRIELELAKKDREKMETSHRFLEHDLAQEVEKTRYIKSGLKDPTGLTYRSKSSQAETATPQKKAKTLFYRDGFDDDEVILLSPSKSGERFKASTPTIGSKRKRARIENSPIQPLPLSESKKPGDGDVHHSYVLPESLPSQQEHFVDRKFQAMQLIMNHHSIMKNERIIESLSRLSFPSTPTQSLSSLIYDEMFLQSSDQDNFQLAINFCNLLLLLWKKCLDEKYYRPLHYLIDWLQFILMYYSATLSVTIAPDVVRQCLATADIIALPTAKAFKNSALYSPPSADIRQQIEPTEYLNLLQLVSFNCNTNTESILIFWKAMEFDFVLLLLHKAQPLNQIILMLQLLDSSIMQESFGAIVSAGPGSPQQIKIESDTIDRLTILLFESPELPHGESRATYTAAALLELRAEVLTLLKALCLTYHGGCALASHRLVIGRLVRFIHESVISMYAYRETTHEQTTMLVNESVLLLSHLTSCHKELIDLRAKLAAVSGGSQKYLVSLSRIAFREGHSILESGIEPRVAEAAHKMLDEHLSPEEGEAVVEVFSSARK